jgi:uncharacterized protein GlcG (DUF336 family)
VGQVLGGNQSFGASRLACAIDVSINKAFTSRAFDISTKKVAAKSQSGGPFFGVHVSNQVRIIIFAGGIPLKGGGKVVGAIGVSGGSESRIKSWPSRAPQHLCRQKGMQ